MRFDRGDVTTGGFFKKGRKWSTQVVGADSFERHLRNLHSWEVLPGLRDSEYTIVKVQL